jgi:hypothetical protein
MAETVQGVPYFYVDVPDKPGEAARILNALKQENVNLLAFCGFPQGRRAQVDFVPADAAAFKAAARRLKLKLTGPKTVFLIQGEDRVGAGAEILEKLAQAQINVVSIQAVSAGGGLYGALLWVEPRNVKKTAQLLGVG